MCIAAASELAQCVEDKGLREDYLIPTMDEHEVFPREAAAVGMKAIEQGLARTKMTRDELYKKSSKIIQRAMDETKKLMAKGLIPLSE